MGENEPLLKHLPRTEKQKECFPIQCRHVLAVMAALGFAVVYALRVNMSVALVEMVNQTYVDAHGTSIDPECKRSQTNSDHENVRLNFFKKRFQFRFQIFLVCNIKFRIVM